MHTPEPLRFLASGASGDPLLHLEAAAEPQTRYLRCYLHDLGARSLIVEPSYFDRDYLSEFVAFYATSAAGYRNICQRVHYFSDDVDVDLFSTALGGDPMAHRRLQGAYLGHLIIRPIEGAPIGRTVLRTYSDEQGIRGRTPRVMEAWRSYKVHVAGLTLEIEGLAWQQQDAAVGSCATIALWSMLHSSAFDDHHAIPTTAAITALGHTSAPTGQRTYPDSGLEIQQVLGVIKERGLAPLLIKGDLLYEQFSRVRFCSLLASLLRSGYPVLVSGFLDTDDDKPPEMHSVCVVGFRSPAPLTVEDDWELDDQNLRHIYVHDDNLGPNVRFLVTDSASDTDNASDVSRSIMLVPDSPEPRHGPWPCPNPSSRRYEIVPTEMVVAVHPELRTSPMALHDAATEIAAWLSASLAHEIEQQAIEARDSSTNGMLVGTRFIRLRDYLERELSSVLVSKDPKILAQARLSLWQEVPPLSLYVGLARFSLGTEPLVDVLFDTSDSDRHLKPTAYIAFRREVPALVERWAEEMQDVSLGALVRAW